MPTNVYVDGFNLYYRALQRRGSGVKWLDLRKLCTAALPGEPVARIRYFTAQVKTLPHDPTGALHQQAYLRALSTLPDLDIHFGRFLTDLPKTMPLANPAPGQSHLVQVLATEEKGSDVNLATYLLLDAFDGEFDRAVVVSNDSDLAEPIRVVRRRFGLDVGILCPTKRPNDQLLQVASFVVNIKAHHLTTSQFPDEFQDRHGTIRKPPGW